MTKLKLQIHQIQFFRRAAGLSLRLSAISKVTKKLRWLRLSKPSQAEMADDTSFYPCPVDEMGFMQDGFVSDRMRGLCENEFHHLLGSPYGAFHLTPDNIGLPTGSPYGTFFHSTNFMVNTKRCSDMSYPLVNQQLPRRGYTLVTSNNSTISSGCSVRSYTLVNQQLPRRGYTLVTYDNNTASAICSVRSYPLVNQQLPRRGYPLVIHPRITFPHSLNHFADA